MKAANRNWQVYATPVAISFAAIAGLNALWHLPALSGIAQAEHSVLVYLLGGSGIALLLLWQALRAGRLTRREVGLDISGWSPWRRLFGAVLAIGIGYGIYANLQLPAGYVDAAEQAAADNPDPDLKVVQKPSASDFCFWAVLMLDSSLAELLVFIVIGFCMVERGLRESGMRSWKATTLAAVFTSFSFGIYHYTHAPNWWPLVYFPLMPVMLISVGCFILTRNFYLTLGLHAMFNAIGLTGMQYIDPLKNNPVDRMELAIMGPPLISFAIPFLVLHWMEGKECGPKTGTTGD